MGKNCGRKKWENNGKVVENGKLIVIVGNEKKNWRIVGNGKKTES